MYEPAYQRRGSLALSLFYLSGMCVSIDKGSRLFMIHTCTYICLFPFLNEMGDMSLSEKKHIYMIPSFPRYDTNGYDEYEYMQDSLSNTNGVQFVKYWYIISYTDQKSNFGSDVQIWICYGYQMFLLIYELFV